MFSCGVLIGYLYFYFKFYRFASHFKRPAYHDDMDDMPPEFSELLNQTISTFLPT